MTAINIITDFDGQAPVYMQYAGQCQPQDAFITLDADGTVSADYSGGIGNAVPADVWNGLDKRISISPFASGYSLQQLFTDKDFIAAVNRYYEGRSTEWNGNNWTSELTEDAEAALEELEQMCCPYSGSIQTVGIWDAGDWIANTSLIVMQEELLQAGSVQAFFDAQDMYADADQFLNFDADDMAEALAYRFEGEANYIEAIKIIVAHDDQYQHLLDDLED